MARGAYRESTDLRTLRQLVAFAEGGADDAALLAEAMRGLVALQRSTRQTTRALRLLTADELRPLKPNLRAFIRYAATPQGRDDISADETLHPIAVTLLPLLGPLKQAKGRWRLLFKVSGTPRDVLLFQVGTLIAAVGEERLQFCPAPDCGKAFIKIGRREYCSIRCQRRVFVSTYNPFTAQPRRTDRHGKPTRKR
jgi:hypothetical protein